MNYAHRFDFLFFLNMYMYVCIDFMDFDKVWFGLKYDKLYQNQFISELVFFLKQASSFYNGCYSF